MNDEEPTPEHMEAMTLEELFRAGLVVYDEVIGDPPPYDKEEARRLLREGDPLALDIDPDC